MDPLTHLTTGALAARGLPAESRRVPGRSRELLTVALLAAVLPDIDNFAGFVNPEFYLIHHRGITHSLTGGVFLALIFAAAVRRLRPGLSLNFLFPFSAVLIGGHIFLDLITSYGTQIFAPFSRERFTVNCVFIIDPIFLGLLVSFLLWAVAGRSTKAARAGLLLLIVYPACTFAVREVLTERLKGELMNRSVPFKNVVLSPEAFSPFVWKGIAESEADYTLYRVRLFGPVIEAEFGRYRRADPALLEEFGRDESTFRTWAWFAAYPFMDSKPASDGGKKIRFGDLRFESTWGFVRERWNGDQRPFSLTAHLDPSGRLRAWQYARPGKEQAMHYLE